MKKKTERILLAATGLNPQIVTETLYALHKKKRQFPHRVVIITTAQGARTVQRELLDNKKLLEFSEEYSLKIPSLTQDDIKILSDEKGTPLEDPHSADNHAAMSDFICDVVRELTSDDLNTQLHVSIAGGRKSMTFLLGYALSLYGREDDILSHTLVTPAYESSDFFYPTRNKKMIKINEQLLDASKAKVTLAEIPYVRLRADIPYNLLNGKSSYSDTVKLLNMDDAKEKLIVDLDKDKPSISYCGYHLTDIAPIVIAFYAWFCYRSIKGLGSMPPPLSGEQEKRYWKEFYVFYKGFHTGKIRGEKHPYQKVEKNNTNNHPGKKMSMDQDFFRAKKSKINRSLIKAFGKRLGEKLNISESKEGNRTLKCRYYSVNLPAKRIVIKGLKL